MKSTHTLATLALLALITVVQAQDAPSPPAEKASQGQVDAYVTAFNKGDAKALAALYAEDAQYTSDSGVVVSGRSTILENLTKFFAKNKDANLAVEVESARFLTPDVLLEKGLATVGDETTRYVCSYVQTDGKWLIAELDETTLPPMDAGAQALGDLGWLVGAWKDDSQGAAVTSTVNWTNSGHFLCRSFTIDREGEDPITGTEVIGYDPVGGAIRSWMFDSKGGFGEGNWTRENNKWINSYAATLPDGTASSAQHVITYIDDKKYTWESVNRQKDGELLPSIDKIEVVRTPDQ